MILPHRLMQAMIDPTGRRGHDHLCDVGEITPSSGRRGSRSGARHPSIRDQDRRDSIISLGRGISTAPGARPGGTDSP